MARRNTNRKPTRSLFAAAVQQHSSGDQVANEPQAVDLSDVDVSTDIPTMTEQEYQAAKRGQTVDLTDVDTSDNTTGLSSRRGRVGSKSREQLTAEMRADELDAQLYIRADNKAKKIRSRPEFQPGNGFFTPSADPSQEGQALRKLNAGDPKVSLNPITATHGYAHVQKIHKELNDFVNNLPTLLKSKADAHDSAADEIEKLYPNHPEVEAHRLEAANIRGFIGDGPDVRNNLREVRDTDAFGSISSDSSRTLNRTLTPIKNKLVDAGAQVAVIPTTQKEAAAGLGTAGKLNENTKRSHSAIKKAHSTLSSLHEQINKMVRPFGVGTPTGAAYMKLQGTRLENLQDNPKAPDVSGYQDVRDDLAPGTEGRLSKPGHIWGDDITVAGQKTGEREQIPISKESVAMLKTRKGGRAQLHATRMSSIIKSGKSPEEKSAETVEKGETNLFNYSPEAEEARLVKARAAGRTIMSDGEEIEIAAPGAPRTQKREGNTVKSVAVDPKKVTVLGTNRGAVQQVAAGRSAVSETEGHINTAVRALIDGRPIPAETIAHIESLPNKNGEQEKVAQTIFDRHAAHQDAVEGAVKAVRETGKMTPEHRAIFKKRRHKSCRHC